jgi:hypothetical protein
MVTPNRIALITHGRYDEAVAGADIYPGMSLIRKSDGKVYPCNLQGSEMELMVALEDALQGLDITQKLASGNVVPFMRPTRGDLFLMLLQAGQGPLLNEAPLQNAGDGTLIAGPAPGALQVLYQILAASANLSALAAETVFSNGTYTIPANFLLAGDVLHIRGKAVVSAQNSTNTHKFKCYVGSTTLADTGAVAMTAADFGSFDIWMTIRAIGASGKFVADVVTVTTISATATELTTTVASTTIDTTVTEAITVKATQSANSAGNVCALQEFEIDLQRPGGQNMIVVSQEAADNSGSTGTSGFNTAMFIRCMVP